MTEAIFYEVPRYEFGGLRQKRPESDQPATRVVEFTLTNHVHAVSTCRVAGWGRAYCFGIDVSDHARDMTPRTQPLSHL